MNNAYVSGNVTFDVVALDMFLKDTMYNVDGSGWVDIGTAFNSTTVEDGVHSVKIRAMDNAGHETMETLTLVVDNTNPMVYIINPFDEQYIEGMYTFQVMAGDDVGIDDVQISIPTHIINMSIGYNMATGYYEYVLDTTDWVDGDYTIHAIAYDSSGMDSGWVMVDFQIDNNAPELSIMSPMNMDYVAGDVLIDTSVMDAFPLDTMYNVDGAGWVDVATALDTTALAAGTHTIQVRARDMAGHMTTETITVIVDNNAPSVGINSPVEGQFLHGTYTFQAIAMDDVGVAEVMMTVTNTDTSAVLINNVPLGYNSATGYYEYTLDTMTLMDGNYSVSCMSYDMAGHASTVATVDFMIDNTMPVLTIVIPHDGDLLTGTISIEVEATDMFLAAVMYNVDDAGWVDIDVDWDTTALADGAHVVAVKAMDEPGHYVMQTIEVKTDNTAPGIYPVSIPMDNEHVGASFFVSVEAKDTMDLDMVTYHFDTMSAVMLFVNKETGFYEAEITTTHLSDGNHDFTLTATDMAGHTSTDARTLFVDNTGPDIMINYPKKSGDMVKGGVRFKVTVTDDTEVESVHIRIDKGDWMEMKMKKGEDGVYTYIWNSRPEYNGEYDVDFKAEDTLGNENEASTMVGVDNFPWIPFIVFIVGLVVMIILMVVFWPRGKKKKKKAAPEPPEESYEETPPPPPPAPESLSEEDMGKESYECPECGATLSPTDTVCPICKVELVEEEPGPPEKADIMEEPEEDETDKLEPPLPEEEE
jgi:hypothetical protein